MVGISLGIAGAVDLIVKALLVEEGVHGRHGLRGIPRVEQLDPLPGQLLHELLPLQSHHRAKAVRHKERDKPFVHSLIIGQGRRHGFILFPQFFRKLIHDGTSLSFDPTGAERCLRPQGDPGAKAPTRSLPKDAQRRLLL